MISRPLSCKVCRNCELESCACREDVENGEDSKEVKCIAVSDSLDSPIVATDLNTWKFLRDSV